MKNILSFLTAVSLIFTYIFGLGEITTSQGYELTRKEKLAPTVSMFAGQGLCCDGEFFYSSGSMTGVNFTGLAKFNLEMKCLKRVSSAIPDEFKTNYQSDHIGGIDCSDGKIYAAVEGDGYKYNFVLVYDCGTLKYTGEYYNLTSEHLTDGIPWLAVDGENRLLYTSKFSDVNEILIYNLETMKLTGTVDLSETVNRIRVKIKIILQKIHEFLGIRGLPVHDGTKPLELGFFLVFPGFHRALFLVLPMGCDTVFRGLMHLKSPDLDLKGHARTVHDRRMQRLVHVRLRHGDIVLETAGKRLVHLMDDAQRGIAVDDVIHQDPDREKIIDLVQSLVLLAHLFIDAEKMLDPSRDLVLDPGFFQAFR